MGDPESVKETDPPSVRHCQGPASFHALDPAEFEATAGQGSANGAGQMRTTFTPVQAGAAEGAFAARQRFEIDTKFSEETATRNGQSCPVGIKVKIAACRQRIGQIDGQPPGQMVVATACRAQGCLFRAYENLLIERSAGSFGEICNAFEQCRDLGRGGAQTVHAIIAMDIERLLVVAVASDNKPRGCSDAFLNDNARYEYW